RPAAINDTLSRVRSSLTRFSTSIHPRAGTSRGLSAVRPRWRSNSPACVAILSLLVVTVLVEPSIAVAPPRAPQCHAASVPARRKLKAHRPFVPLHKRRDASSLPQGFLHRRLPRCSSANLSSLLPSRA